MQKYHVRKNKTGDWVEENGYKIPAGSPLVYHYGTKPQAPPPGHVVSRIRSAHPHVSANAGVHVDQVASFNKQCSRGTSYDPRTGNLVSTSSAAREREARRRGMSFS